MKWLFKKERKHLALEISLILASVLIFRSAWIILDKIPLLNEAPYLLVMLIIGIIITIFGFEALFKHEKYHP